MNYTTIKIPDVTHKLIKDLCVLSDLPQQKLIYNSLQEYKKEIFWEKCNNAYLKINRSKEDDELGLYENTLMDGIENEY